MTESKIGIKLVHMHPILFTIGNFSVYTYGFTMALGFIIAFGWVFYSAQNAGEPLDQYYNICLLALVGGIVGARVMFVAINWKTFIGNWSSIINLRSGGMVWYGGLLTVIPIIYGYTRWKKMSFYRVADLLSPPTILGLAIGRIGCLMSGCCYGSTCSLPWAIRYPSNPMISPDLYEVTVHPSPLYEMLAAFIISGFLAYLNKHKTKDGQVVWSFLLLYSTARFILEIWRGDSARGYIFGGLLSVSQTIGIPVVMVSVIMLLRLRKSNA